MNSARNLTLSIFLTVLLPISAHGQGLDLSEVAQGHITATATGDDHTAVDISGDAAKVIFLKLKDDPTSQSFGGRGPYGKIVDEIFVNGGMTCSRNIQYGTSHCSLSLLKGRIVIPGESESGQQ